MSIQYRIVERKIKLGNTGETKCTYALKLPSRQAPIDEVAELISERSAMSRGDVLSVLENLGWACKIIMRSGASVSLPHFGSISSTLRSKAAKEGEKWTPERVKGVSLRFTPSTELRSALKGIGFEQVKNEPNNSGSADSGNSSSPTPPISGGSDEENDTGI